MVKGGSTRGGAGQGIGRLGVARVRGGSAKDGVGQRNRRLGVARGRQSDSDPGRREVSEGQQR